MLLRDSQPGESLHCARRALRVPPDGRHLDSPRCLHLRRAHTYAVLTDRGGFSREMTKARQRVGARDRTRMILGFVDFVNEQEVNGIRGSRPRAGQARPCRSVVPRTHRQPSPGHRRNQVYYTVHLSEAAYRQGDVNEAARIALNVLPAVSQMNSGRIAGTLREVRSNLAASQQATAATRRVRRRLRPSAVSE